MDSSASPDAATGALPIGGLLALSAAGFATMLTETVPAGLLPSIGGGLGVAAAQAGQLLTVYAAGSVLAAIPLTSVTRTLPRRPLLMATVLIVAAVNTLTAVTDSYLLGMIGRFAAGMAAGVQWAMIAGYAMRLVDPAHRGRALAIAMAGVPLALALGVPIGTLAGGLIGWRGVFSCMALAGLVILVLVRLVVPPQPGEKRARRQLLTSVAARPGLAMILVAALGFEVGHMAAFTYVAPLLGRAGLGGHTGLVLLLFGFSAVLGLWITGVGIDIDLRAAAIACLLLFTLCMLALALAGTMPAVVLVAAAAWGLALGGAPTIFQAVCAGAAGPATDLAQSMLVTVLNAGMAIGSAAGGLALHGAGTQALPWFAAVVFFGATAVILIGRRSAFPPPARNDVGPRTGAGDADAPGDLRSSGGGR